jgi:nicotinamide-nucleotide amidase
MIELIAIGDEVLYGYTVNHNASFIAQALLEKGYACTQHRVVGDDPVALKKVLEDALKRNACVITTGGLGPTCDDWTRKVVCELYGIALHEPAGLREKLIATFGKKISSLEDQVLVPQGSHLFENRLGTASGFSINRDGATLIALPGVPQEMRAMFASDVLSYLELNVKLPKKRYFEVVHLFYLKESEIDGTLREIEKKYPQVLCGIYPGYSTITVHFSAEGEIEELAFAKQQLIAKYAQHVCEKTLGDEVHALLLEKKITLATAESCTAGALAASFVANPDASKYYQGSIIAYNNQMKEQLLQIDPIVLDHFGAISKEVTLQMAEQVRTLMNTDCGIAVSGIFGPTGGTAEKPVGTVCMTIALKNFPPKSQTFHFVGNRSTISERTVQAIKAELLFLLRQIP